MYNWKAMNLGFQELLVIFLVILLVFGPKKLPQLAQALGKAVREFRNATREIEESIKEIERSVDLEEKPTPPPPPSSSSGTQES